MLLHEVKSPTLLIETDDDMIFCVEELTESSRFTVRNSKGGLVSKAMQGITGMVKKHPFLTGAAAAYAIDAYQQYKKNKRKTVTFFTKDVQEKKLYSDIVDTLMKTGSYRKVKSTVVDGGWYWELKKLN